MKKKINKIIFVFGLILFSYTLIRAYVLSFTWDESFSYLHYVRNEVFFPDKYYLEDANNHFLNTWLSIFLVSIFGVSEFVLRLPALFAHLLFLVFSFKLVKNFTNAGLAVASFLIINLNPYLLDFFSLSRGYALSLGLMTASIYYVYLFSVNEFKIKYAIWAVILGGLATAANFVLLNYFIISFGLIQLCILIDFIEKKKKGPVLLFKSLVFQSAIFFLLLSFFLPVILKLKEAHALFYGGDKGFWKDTFGTITDRSFYELGYNYWFQRIAKGFVMLIIIAATVFVGAKYVKKQTNKNSLFLTILVLLICFCALSTIIQHFVFGIPYLMDRTAIFLVVLFNLVFVVFINELTKEENKAAFITYLAGAFMVLHFILSFNLTHVLEWKWDADIKQMMLDLDQVMEIPKEKNNISIAIPLEFEQGINFYRAKDNLSWINSVTRSERSDDDKRHDYLYLTPYEFAKMNMDSIEVIKRYPETNTILAKPKYAPLLTKVRFSQQMDFEKTPQAMGVIDEEVEYFQNFNYTIQDSLARDKNAEVVFRAEVMAEDILKNNLLIVISFENSKGIYEWKEACVKDFIVNTNEWTDIYCSALVPKKCVAGDKLKAYLWNPNKHQLLVKNMELKWLSKI